MPDPSDPLLDENEQVARSKALLERGEQPGNGSPLTCPDCGGVLWELRDNSMVFNGAVSLHVGHAYSLDSLLEEQAQDVEKSLWTAVRALEEKAALARRMAAYARSDQSIVLRCRLWRVGLPLRDAPERGAIARLLPENSSENQE